MPDTSLKFIGQGNKFPTDEQAIRIAKYKLNEKRYSGTYGSNVKLILCQGTDREVKLPYQLLKINKFKLYTNKMDSLIFGNDITIKSGCDSRDTEINNLVNRTQWVKNIRKAFKYMEMYGDAYIKTYKYGCSAVHPYNAVTIVDPHDTDRISSIVLFEYLFDSDDSLEAIRFEIHTVGYIYEVVYEYNGIIIGNSIQYKYNNRTINKGGTSWKTNTNCILVQKLSIDNLADGVYGVSPYEDFAQLVHEIERRQTIDMKILDAHGEPTVAVSAGMFRENELTGKVEADIMGGYLEVPIGGTVPQYITFDGKLENSDTFKDRLTNEIYELTELGKTFMTGEYSGNISEESLNSLVKSAIDRGNRHVNDIWYEFINSLFCLCQLNGISVDIDELSIEFNVGSGTTDKDRSSIIIDRVTSGTLSLETALMKFSGLTKEQAQVEIERIRKEKSYDTTSEIVK